MSVLKDKWGFEYRDDVTFEAELSKFDSCCCNGCHKSARVMKIFFPDTGYVEPKYDKLVMKRKSMWLCMDCVDKLREAIRKALKAEPPEAPQ